MIVGIMLLIIGTLAFISVVFGNEFIDSSLIVDIDNDLIVNGTTSSFGIPVTTINYNIDALSLSITILVALSIGVTLLGANLLGSGLNSEATRLLSLILAYTSIWAIFSNLAWNLIYSIETFGGLLWIALTIIYGYGVIKQLS